MVVRNKDTGKCSIIDPCYDPGIWNKPRKERVTLKRAMANNTLRVEKDKDGWISVWYKNRFISGWLTYDINNSSSDILYIVARMIQAEEQII